MTETAKMYGGSLYDLAAEEGLETRILGELDEVQQLLKQNPDYLRLLSTPSIPKKERCGLLDEALRGQVHLYVLNFLKILCEKGTLRELSGCARAYRIRYNQAHGILEATAISAVPLTEQQRAALHAKLESLTARPSTLKPRWMPRCWAESGWISRAPSWTAPSRTVLPPCAGILRRSLCNFFPALCKRGRAQNEFPPEMTIMN